VKMNGLSIQLDEFQRLPQKQQMALLYENTERILTRLNSYSVRQKLVMWWIGVITAIGSFLGVELIRHVGSK
jgi:hypothetical protein